ncbi:hypothetical protein [Nocardiopsis lucentensis]|uniref:hypothetical protein n=1 Tax=Nocardiopsis lucentensis TaxID=53441 RepID=UPI000684A4ED|nr:hypothetical protein [Nocardiopsis lucentensis]
MWRFRRTSGRVPTGTGIEAALVSAAYGTDPVLRSGCEVVREGGVAAGLALLGEERDDAEVRAHRAEALGRAAVDRVAEVASLAEGDADEADVMLWLGHVLLARAATRPTGGAATGRADRKALEAGLIEARAPLEAAAHLRPDDAAPWAALQTVAMGLGADREEKDRIWGEVTERAPHLFPAHMTRVRSLSPNRGGSTEEMFAVAGAAADGAPEGDPLPAVLALAHAEHLRAERKRLIAEGSYDYIADMILGRLHGEAVRELFEAARAWVSVAAPHERDVQAHHLFGWAFHRADVAEAARWHLGAVGHYYCELPWSFFGDARAGVAHAMARVGVDPRVRPEGGPT